MRAAVMLGRHLDVLPADVAVGVLILDANVREMDLLVEVRQAVLARPLFDLFRCAVGPAVAVAVAAIALLQEALVLAFQRSLALPVDCTDPCTMHLTCLRLSDARRCLMAGGHP